MGFNINKSWLQVIVLPRPHIFVMLLMKYKK